MNDKLKWFEYIQNNSGGSYDRDENLDTRVYIQAHSADEADEFAGVIGIYFGGVRLGMDCECCGDRWYGCSEVDDDVVNNSDGGVKIHPWGKIQFGVDSL